MFSSLGVRALAILTLTLAAPGARAEEFRDCKGVDDAGLHEAMIKAQDLAAKCLIQDGLNPDLGKKIAAMRSGGSLTLHCAYKIPSLAVTSTDSTRVKVDLEDHARGEPRSVPDLAVIDLTVFHELIHVADPKAATTVFSVKSHNSALGFPDGVNGCEFACARSFDHEVNHAQSLLDVFEGVVKPLAEDAAYVCPQGAGADCARLKKLAGLCRGGVPELTVDERFNFRIFESGVCVKRMISMVPAADSEKPAAALREARAEAEGRQDLAAHGRDALMLTKILKILTKTWRSGSFGDKLWLKRFLSDQKCPQPMR